VFSKHNTRWFKIHADTLASLVSRTNGVHKDDDDPSELITALANTQEDKL
jgi:hypothetical protein